MNRNDTPINGAAGASIVAIPVNQPTIDRYPLANIRLARFIIYKLLLNTT